MCIRDSSKTFGKHSVSAFAAFEVMKYDYEDLYAAKKTYGQDINTSLGNAADPIDADQKLQEDADRKSTRLNSSHSGESRMPSSA